MTQPFEVVGDPSAAGPFVFTCEHASNAIVEWEPSADDRVLIDDHWGWDIGAGDLTRELVARTESCGVLSDFSRLVCDPNRGAHEESFVVREIDGQPVSFNVGVDAAECRRRSERYAEPYHAAIDATVRTRLAAGFPPRLVSIHSFTPTFLGRHRPMEVGVLFDDFDELAWGLEGALTEQGFESVLNAPYSGRDGLIFAARRHGREHGLVYLELEVRQDLIADPKGAAEVGARVAKALEIFAP